MGKISKSTIAALILTVLCLFILPAQGQYNGGSGDPCDPYQINDPCQLNAIGTDPGDWDKHFILTADIDMSAYTGEQFNVIAPDANDVESGFQGTKFTGFFDGNGHIITNFTYSTIETDYIGLFGYLGDGGEIKDLGMTNVSVSGGNYSDHLGSLVGYNNHGSISDCYAIGIVSGDDYLGGLVGENNGSIRDCYMTGSVSGDDYLGGLVGYNRYGSIRDCYMTGSVSGDDYLGGLVGYNRYGSISNCYTTGSVSGGDNSCYLGGLVGFQYSSNINNCFATGSVTGHNMIGGLVGWNDDERTPDSIAISDCYSTGDVTGDSSIGGLVGYNSFGTISNCYATGNVMGNYNSVGGLVGLNEDVVCGGVVANCYATGDVTGYSKIGGLVGYNMHIRIYNCYATGSVTGNSDYLGGMVGYDISGSYTGSFWDSDVNPGLTGVGNLEPDPDGVIGETTANMQIQNTFTDEGWDFVGEDVNGTDDFWRMPYEATGYPMLYWQRDIAGDFVGSYGVDLADFAVLAETWSLSSGQVGYNDLCDLMDDDVIDLADLAVFAENWLAGK